MVRLAFDARDSRGARVNGVRDAVSDTALLAELRREGLVTLRVAPAVARGDDGRRSLFGPSAGDIALEIRQIAFLLKSGVTLLEGLKICADQSRGRPIARVLDRVAASIRGGSSLGDALRAQSLFDDLTCSLVDVGESGGRLDTVLERAADVLERRARLRSQMTTALIYPALVLVMALATVAYMMVGVIPKLSQFLASFGRQLPPSTRLLVDLSNLVRHHYLDALLVAAIVAASIFALSRTARGRSWIDAAIVRTPVVGSIVSLAATTAFAYTLALLLRSGVRITRALEVVEPTLPLTRYAIRVANARAGVVRGSGLSEALTREAAFDPIVHGMIAVGESSGRLDEVLEHLADHHDARLRDLVRRLGTILEPVILVVIGAIVGFVYLSFFSAVYSFAGRR
jgi:type IV pilus assembly protein PilC